MTLAPPAVPAFAAGYGPLPSDMNSLAQATLGFQATGIVFRAEMHTGQAIGAGAPTVIQFDAILEDPYSGWNSGSHYWLAPYAGWYEVTVFCGYSVAAGSVEGCAGISGLTYELAQMETGSTAGFFGGGAASVTVPLIGGSDYVQGIAFSATATTLNTLQGRYSAIEISFISQ